MALTVSRSHPHIAQYLITKSWSPRALHINRTLTNCETIETSIIQSHQEMRNTA